MDLTQKISEIRQTLQMTELTSVERTDPAGKVYNEWQHMPSITGVPREELKTELVTLIKSIPVNSVDTTPTV